jgi:hypothetical protein
VGEKLLFALLLLVCPVRDEHDGAGIEPLVGDLLLAVPTLKSDSTFFVERGSGLEVWRLGLAATEQSRQSASDATSVDSSFRSTR